MRTGTFACFCKIMVPAHTVTVTLSFSFTYSYLFFQTNGLEPGKKYPAGDGMGNHSSRVSRVFCFGAL